MSSAHWRIGVISKQASTDPADVAAYWHARVTGDAAAGDEPAFEQWRQANPDNREAYDRVTSGHDGIRALADAPEILSLRHQTLARLAMKRRSDQRVKTGAGIAVAIAVVATPILAFQSGFFASRRAVITADARGSSGTAQSFRTSVGQRLALTLSDGSRVVLNTTSRLRVRYSKDERQLALDEGQAWFEVAKDKARPFRVHAGGQQVEAHGTAFDVRVMPAQTEVMLAEGHVTVNSEQAGGAGVAMQPNQLLVVSASGTTVSRVADPDSWASWRRGIVTFDSVPLARVVSEMNRYSETKLKVADVRTGRIVVSGGFNAGATEAFVEALSIRFKVQSQKDASGNVVLTAE